MTNEEQIQKLTAERDALKQKLVDVEGLNEEWNKELVDKLTRERDAALKACAEMRDVLGGCHNHGCFIKRPTGQATNGPCQCRRRAAEVLASTNCGKGYVKAESLKCFKCDDGHTPLYCLNCARKGYRHDDEWRPVVEALRQTLEHLKVMFDIDGRPLDPNDREIVNDAEKALAHAESLLKK